MEGLNNNSTCLPVRMTLTSAFRFDGQWITNILYTVPLTVPAAQGGGVFGGYWVTMHVQQVADHVSWMKWGVYRCVAGNPFGTFP